MRARSTASAASADRLRIGLHTGEVQLRDEANYIGPTINRTARLRDLAHGGQTVLSGTTTDLVCDRLPADAWLAELGTHPSAICLGLNGWCNSATPISGTNSLRCGQRNVLAPINLPAQLTSFVGRTGQIDDVCRLLLDNRLVTLTGAGGAGKTRLAVEVAGRLSDEFEDGVWWVDLAPVADPSWSP